MDLEFNGGMGATADAQRQRIREEQVEAYFKVSTFSVCAALIGAVILTLIIDYVGALRLDIGLKWLGAMSALGVLHIALTQLYVRARPVGRKWRLWAFWSSAITFVEGLGWGYAPLGLPQPDNHEALLLAMLTTIGVSAGAVIAYGRYLPTLVIAFVTPNTPFLIYSLFTDDLILRGGGLLLVLFMLAIGQLGLAAHRGFLSEIAMRMRNEELALDLRRQKEIAEQANIAKSAFLAAASHDLRQPIHALGLYVGALRALPHAAEAELLIHRIEASIGAMDRLFSALLDISRLDAGVVEVRSKPIAIDEFLERVCLDHKEDAAQKGLQFAARSGKVIVRSDPLLLERIVRNLLSNAVRYTDHGSVLVRCRQRGDAIALQVWDTGRGIPREYRQAIFQEYFQIGNPERDREKGLGLGLAIVKRLTDLLESRLTVLSRVDRGSCFEILLPASRDGRTFEEHDSAERTIDAERALIVVVDDEASIRDAMFRLLQRWGYEVVVASSGDEAFNILVRHQAPSLLICDYRLRGAETGVEAVQRLRSHFNDPEIPAILITGDTDPNRLADARRSGLLLLHKPVSNVKLRASISNLIAHGRERETVL